MKHFRFLRAKFLRYKWVFIVGAFIAAAIVFTRIPIKPQISQSLPTHAPTSSPSLTPTPMPLIIRGSIPYWDQNKAVASFRQNVDAFSEIALFWYYLTDEGEINRYAYAKEDKSLIGFAHANNVRVTAVLTNLPEKGSWDSRRVERMLKDSETRGRHIADIVNLLSRLNFDGISIDYEEVSGDQKEKFADFIKELASALHQHGKFVGVALHPKTGEQSDSRYEFQDWHSLGKDADEFYIMSYEQHDNEGPPGPDASLPWVKRILTYTKEQSIPAGKLFLGIPLYGYDWNHDNDKAAVGLTYQDVQRLIKRFSPTVTYDESLASPHFTYEESGQRHEVWYEDKRSVEAKVSLAKKYGLGGITFWRLGGEDPEVWKDLQGYLNNNSY